MSDRPVILGISGDPVIGGALALLLGGSRYDTRFLPEPPSGEPPLPETLEEVDVLLVAPMPGESDWRQQSLARLGVTARTMGIPVLRLAAVSEGEQGEGRGSSRYTVPWPCKTEELERRIEQALPGDPEPNRRGRRRPFDGDSAEGG